MLETPHVILGATIAAKIHPALALPTALISHFVMDMVPHWNPHLNTEIKKFGKVSNKTTAFIVADVILSLIIGFFIAWQYWPNWQMSIVILIAAFLAVSPDVIEAPYYFMNKKGGKPMEKFIAWQKSIQYDTNPFFGSLTQIFVIVASLVWLTN